MLHKLPAISKYDNCPREFFVFLREESRVKVRAVLDFVPQSEVAGNSRMSAVLRLTEHDTPTGDGNYFSCAAAFDYDGRFWLRWEVRGFNYGRVDQGYQLVTHAPRPRYWAAVFIINERLCTGASFRNLFTKLDPTFFGKDSTFPGKEAATAQTSGQMVTVRFGRPFIFSFTSKSVKYDTCTWITCRSALDKLINQTITSSKNKPVVALFP